MFSKYKNIGTRDELYSLICNSRLLKFSLKKSLENVGFKEQVIKNRGKTGTVYLFRLLFNVICFIK